MHQNPLEGLLKCTLPRPRTRGSDSVVSSSSGVEPEIGISNKFPGDGDATGLGPTLEGLNYNY